MPGPKAANVAKGESDKPPEFTIIRKLMFAIDEFGPSPLGELSNEHSVTTNWRSSAFLLAPAVEEMDAKPGCKVAPGMSCLSITVCSQLEDLSTLGSFTNGFQAAEQAGR